MAFCLQRLLTFASTPGLVIGPLVLLLYMYCPSAALNDSAVHFADEVKTVFLRSQSSRLLFSPTSLRAWVGPEDLSLGPIKRSYLSVGSFPPLFQSFTAADAIHQMPLVTEARDLGVG